MKRALVLLLIGLTILLLTVGIYRYFHTTKSQQIPTQGTFPTSTNGSTDSGNNYRVTIKANDGSNLVTNDFISSGYKDEFNQGYYGLESPKEGRYEIRYIASTQYFNIALLEEPLGENRKLAEARLLQLLGISKEDLCKLAYSVSVPNDVNSEYSGMNLGFSFCPGAVKLP